MINTATIVATFVLSLAILAVPRKYLLVPFIMAICFIPPDQRIIITELDFTILRFCIIFGVLRLFVRGEVARIRWNTFDRIVLVWAVLGAAIYILQWQSISAVIYKTGVLFDLLGLYWIFRQQIYSWDHVHLVVKIFAILALVSAVFGIIERIVQINLFSTFGNVVVIGVHRGRYRCCGVFGNAIIFGLFWANLIPWFLAYLKTKRDTNINIIGIVGSLVCVFLSASSTPILTALLIFSFFLMYRYRSYGKKFAIGLCCLIVMLHMIRQQPVWHLLSRVNIFGGSTGWHRYNLIDQAIQHFGEWVLLGTRDTEHWGWGLRDITNHYVFEGVTGGLLSLLLFVILLIYAIRTTWAFSLHSGNHEYRCLSWGICVSVLGHCVSFFGVSYFGQIRMLLYLTFSLVAFVTGQVLSERNRVNYFVLA